MNIRRGYRGGGAGCCLLLLFGLLKGRRGRSEKGEPFLEEGEKREERDDHLKIRKRQLEDGRKRR